MPLLVELLLYDKCFVVLERIKECSHHYQWLTNNLWVIVSNSFYNHLRYFITKAEKVAFLTNFVWSEKPKQDFQGAGNRFKTLCLTNCLRQQWEKFLNMRIHAELRSPWQLCKTSEAAYPNFKAFAFYLFNQCPHYFRTLVLNLNAVTFWPW